MKDEKKEREDAGGRDTRRGISRGESARNGKGRRRALNKKECEKDRQIWGDRRRTANPRFCDEVQQCKQVDKYEEIEVEPRTRDCVIKCNKVNKYHSAFSGRVPGQNRTCQPTSYMSRARRANYVQGACT